MKSSYLVKLISLFLAEIIPEVTVPPRQNGLPIAITQSPTLALSEFPNLTKGNFSLVCIIPIHTKNLKNQILLSLKILMN